MIRRLQIGLLWMVAGSCIGPLGAASDDAAHRDATRLYGTYAYIIKVEQNVPKSPVRHGTKESPFYMIYQGQLMLLHGKVAVLKRKRHNFVFSIVITPDVDYTMRAGGGVALKDEEPVRWFDITFVWTGSGWSCQIEELAREKMATLLPDHAVVLLYDPARVKALRQPVCACYCRDSAYDGGCCTFELPVIELQGTVEDHVAAHTRVAAALPGIRSFHQQVSSVVQVVESGYCSLHMN